MGTGTDIDYVVLLCLESMSSFDVLEQVQTHNIEFLLLIAGKDILVQAFKRSGGSRGVITDGRGFYYSARHTWIHS